MHFSITMFKILLREGSIQAFPQPVSRGFSKLVYLRY